MAAMVPVMIGQRIVQMMPAQAVEAIRSGAARLVGSQGATNSAGPFTSGFTTNLPPVWQRPGLVGRGVAGALGLAGAAAGGAGSGSSDRDALFSQLNRSGMPEAGAPPSLMDQIMAERGDSPYGTLPPAGSFPGMTNMDDLRARPSPYGALPPAGSFPGMTSMDDLRARPSPYGTLPPAGSFPGMTNMDDLRARPSPYGTLPSAESFAAAQQPPIPMMVNAPTPQSLMPVGSLPRSENDAGSPMFGSMMGIRSFATPPMPPPRPAGIGAIAETPPLPPSRPANIGVPVGAPMQLASAAPSVRESFMQRLLSGPNYQSNNMPALMTPQGPTPSGAPLPQQVNWGDADNAADFFRAEQVARQMGLLG